MCVYKCVCVCVCVSVSVYVLSHYSTVEKYSHTVRQSNFVRFAIDIALAFSSNNYAKFFKLIR